MDTRDKLNRYVQSHFTEPANRKNRAAVNKLLRAIDDSHLWPVCGNFNATERAINRYNRLCNQYGMEIADCVYSYAETIEGMISEIVNNEV